MSWIEKELKRRTVEPKPAAPGPAPASAAPDRLQELWTDLLAVNQALPDELRLRREPANAGNRAPEEANVREWLRATNGAALGFAGSAIRYTWPEKRKKGSNNFWLLWNASRQRHVVQQRVGAGVPPAMAEYRFAKVSAERMIKYLVLGQRLKPRAVRLKRFWFF